MNLKELKEIIDYEVNNLYPYIDPENVPVLINLIKPSMDAKDSTSECEHNQFRIEPNILLVKKESLLCSIKSKELGGIRFWKCQMCNIEITRDDNFCRHCGRKLRQGEYNED